MKKCKKFIAVLLSVILISSFALPVACFAASDGTTQNDHTSFEEFWESMTDEEGNVDWTKLPKALFKVFVMVRFFEVIANFFRGIFGGTTTPAETTEVIA